MATRVHTSFSVYVVTGTQTSISHSSVTVRHCWILAMRFSLVITGTDTITSVSSSTFSVTQQTIFFISLQMTGTHTCTSRSSSMVCRRFCGQHTSLFTMTMRVLTTGTCSVTHFVMARVRLAGGQHAGGQHCAVGLLQQPLLGQY